MDQLHPLLTTRSPGELLMGSQGPTASLGVGSRGWQLEGRQSIT